MWVLDRDSPFCQSCPLSQACPVPAFRFPRVCSLHPCLFFISATASVKFKDFSFVLVCECGCERKQVRMVVSSRFLELTSP